MSRTTWDIITDRMTGLKKQYDRMDNSRKLAYLEGYKLKNFDGSRELSQVINVTGNKAAVFANAIITDLQRLIFQPIIEGEVSTRDAARIEGFIEDNFYQADEYILQRYGVVGLFEWLCNHVCIRGPIGVEWYPWIEGGEYNIHCLPLDMRWTPYMYGAKGLKWVAPISWRTSEELISEFEEKGGVELSAIPRDKTDLEVRDYWDSEKNEIWVEKRKVFEGANPLKKVPFVIVNPPSGFMLRDKGFVEHEGEDIFYLIRGLNDELNRTLSIEQSLIFNVLRPAYEYEVENPDASPAVAPPLPGQTQKRKKGERHVPVPTGDMNRANLTALQDIHKMIDDGAPTAPRAYTQPPSGAELLLEIEALSRLQNSRMVALKVFREQLARWMIESYRIVASDASFSIGGVGRKRRYSVVQLKDPDKYTISFRLMSKNKRQELANLAMFETAYNRLPLRYNLENVLQVEDPDAVIRELELEESRKADPAIGIFEMAVRCAEEAEDIEDENLSDIKKMESKMLTERCVALIKERKMPAPLPDKARVPTTAQQSGGSSNLMSLLGGTGGPGRSSEFSPPEAF